MMLSSRCVGEEIWPYKARREKVLSGGKLTEIRVSAASADGRVMRDRLGAAAS